MARIFYRFWRIVHLLGRWLNRRLTRAGQLVLAAMAVTALFGINTHANLAYQIFCFLVALALTARLAARFAPDVTFRRILPRYALTGQPLTYRLRLNNNGARALKGAWVSERLADPAPSAEVFGAEFAIKGHGLGSAMGFGRWQRLCRHNTMARAPVTPLAQVAPHADTDVALTLLPLRRGRLELHGLALGRPDPLGLYVGQQTVWDYDAVLVLPKIFPVPAVALPGSRRFQPGGVALASSVGDAEEFVSLRDYRHGDPLRRIHWKSWARTGKPIVKEYQEEYFVRHALILDTFGEGPANDVFEDAVSLAASFICAMAHSEILIDLMFVGPQPYCFTSGRGLAHTDKMLEILACVDLCRDKPFASLLPLVTGRLGQLSACICVLTAWDEPRRQLIGALRSARLPLKVFVIRQDGAVTEPGPMADQPEHFHVLAGGRLAEQLAAIGQASAGAFRSRGAGR